MEAHRTPTEPEPEPEPKPAVAATVTTTVTSTRSYECAFCKRGFSNAQALGGHMNVHRKDRVKLKPPVPDRTCGGPRQLALFVERPSTVCHDEEEEKVEHEDIDLELRLGP